MIDFTSSRVLIVFFISRYAFFVQKLRKIMSFLYLKNKIKGSYINRGEILSYSSYMAAITSISTSAPLGKSLTATAERAGYGSQKNWE